MVAKQKTKALERKLEKIKTWHLVVLLLMFGFLAATFLRLNNVGMDERRQAVLMADEEGDDSLIAKRLYDLQRYVSSHMHTDTGRIPLDGKYQRDNQALKESLENQSDSNPQGNVYKKAAEVCDPIGQSQGWRWPDPRYTDCVNRELEKYPAASELQTQYQPLPVESYYHSFSSPIWSPDFAGWTILLCIVIIMIILFRLAALGILKLLLKFKYRKV